AGCCSGSSLRGGQDSRRREGQAGSTRTDRWPYAFTGRGGGPCPRPAAMARVASVSRGRAGTVGRPRCPASRFSHWRAEPFSRLRERLVWIGELLRWPGEGAGEVAAEALVGGHRVDRPAGEPAGLGAADAGAEEGEQPVDREPGAVQVDAALEVGVERSELGQV